MAASPYLEVGVEEPLKETHIKVPLHRSHGPATRSVLSPHFLVLRRHGRVGDAAPGRHEHAAIHDGPVPEVDEVPGRDNPASSLGTNLDKKL